MKTYNKYTDEKFKDVQAFQDFLQSGRTLKYDYVIVAGILYTMHEYDMEGKQVTWANKKHGKMIEVNTSDRYKNGYIDAQVLAYDAWYLRSDITYAE